MVANNVSIYLFQADDSTVAEGASDEASDGDAAAAAAVVAGAATVGAVAATSTDEVRSMCVIAFVSTFFGFIKIDTTY